MNFANNLAKRVKKTSPKEQTKTLKPLNITRDIELQIGGNKKVLQNETNLLPNLKTDSRTLEEQIQSLTFKINKLKQIPIKSEDQDVKIEAISQEISTLVSNFPDKNPIPRSGLVINEKLNFKIEKLKTNKFQLQKVIKKSKVVTTAFFTTIDESMFDANYVAPNFELQVLPIFEPIVEILVPIKSELVNTIIYHTKNDEIYGYHVLEQNNIMSDHAKNKKSILSQSANIWTDIKIKMGMDSFSLKVIEKKR